MNKFWNHLKTVSRHRHQVFLHCIRAGITFQGITHDLSKFSPCEFFYGVKFYQGTRSPHEGERETYGFSYGWLHHKGTNRHHFEYWTDYDPVTRKLVPVRMPVKYVKEMFCDRVAASKTYLKEKYSSSAPLEYFMKSKGTRFIHQETSDLLEKLLRMLIEKGEDETFRYIRELKEYEQDTHN